MPFKQTVDIPCIIWEYFGVLNNEDILASNAGFYQHPDRQNIRYQIVDFNQVTEIRITADCIREIAFRDRDLANHLGSMHILAIATTPVSQGIVMMYERIIENPLWPVTYVASQDEARQWIQRQHHHYHKRVQ